MEEEYSLNIPIPLRPPSVRPVIVVQARMGSTRLPGKVLMLMDGVPMLQGLLQRLASLQPGVAVLLATTTHSLAAPLVEIAHQCGVDVFCGSEENVLDRFAKAVERTSADTIVRLTADCPLTDPSMVDKALHLFYHSKVDYLSNTLRRTYPRGFDIEIFSRKALFEASKEATLLRDKEHVTPFILTHKDRFSRANFVDSEDFSSWRLTVDTKDDFKIVEKVRSSLGTSFTYEDVKKLMRQHPEWQQINAHVEQKRE